jgi:3-isopropylmalate/(R)-2-methylmalate dehydratase small subunit
MPARFTTLSAIAAPLEAANVDTDQIIPARFLKVPRESGYGRFLFHDLRENPGFILNRAPYDRARILVAAENFGCGSSREGAAYALYDAGFRALVAPSFGDIFYANCLKNGILPARLASQICADLRRLLAGRPGTELTIDLASQQVVAPDGSTYPFAVDEFHRVLLLEGRDEVELTLSRLPAIEAFERAYAAQPGSGYSP